MYGWNSTVVDRITGYGYMVELMGEWMGGGSVGVHSVDDLGAAAPPVRSFPRFLVGMGWTTLVYEVAPQCFVSVQTACVT